MDLKNLKLVIEGNKEAFAKFYDENFDLLWRYVLSRIRNRDIASDIVSESFVALYENVCSIRKPKALRAYLYRIAKNKMIEFYAREKTVNLSEFDLDRMEIEKRGKREVSRKLKIKLEEVLEKLPDHYADVLRLRFVSGLKIKEVAEILGKTEGNIKVIQNRAIKKARKIVNNLNIEK